MPKRKLLQIGDITSRMANKLEAEFDIIEYAIEGDRDRMGCILWEHKKEQFIIKDLDDITLDIPFAVDGLVLFASEDIKFRAYLFAQPDLMHALGVRDN